jgi:hypothetical protein
MTLTDQDIIAQQRQTEKAAKTRLVRTSIAMMAAIGILIALSAHGVFARAGISPGVEDILIPAAAGIFALTAMYLFWRAKTASKPDDRITKLRIDEFQGQQRRVLTAVIVLFCGFALFTVIHPLRGRSDIALDFGIEFALLAAVAAAAVCFGPGFLLKRYRVASGDEYFRLLRGRASQIGYMIVVAGLAAAYVLSLLRPEWLRVAIPAVLAVGIVCPAVYFLVADRRAASLDG